MASVVAVLGTCRYHDYTPWLLLLLYWVHAGSMTTLQKETHPCLEQIWDTPLFVIYYSWKNGVALNVILLFVAREVSHSICIVAAVLDCWRHGISTRTGWPCLIVP